ncbi:MAG: PepSY domain-containing protein [Burkholderiales bacterium]|nr:PepSY domain-containing protein [Burkholderiales bacterium]
MRTHPSLVALLLGLAAAPVLAGDDCDAPVRDWQSRDAVMQMAAQRGWQVQRLKIDDGCYEIRGRDAQGRAFKAKLDPRTLRLVKMKVRDRDHDKERNRSRARAEDREAPPPGAEGGNAPPSTPARSPLLAPGTTPRSSIE